MNNEDQTLEITRNNGFGMLIGLLIGGLAGAVTMLLMAPQSGEKTRMQIQEKSIELRDKASYMIEDTLGQARLDANKLSRRGRQKAKELMHDGQEMVNEQIKQVTDAVKASGKAIKIS